MEKEENFEKLEPYNESFNVKHAETINPTWSYHATNGLQVLFFPPDKLVSILLIYSLTFLGKLSHQKTDQITDEFS